MASVLDDMVCAATLTARLTNTVQGQTVQTRANQLAFSLSLTAGTTANKADIFYQEVDRALTSASNDDLDIFDLAVFDQTTDLLGQTISFVEVVALIVRNQSGSAGDLVLGGETSAAAWNSIFSASDTATVTIKPGGFLIFAAPTDAAYAVADSTNHLLRVNASGGNITYDIGILGRSA